MTAETFDLHCFQTPTGTKFLLLVEPQCPQVPVLLGRIYELYSDYVLKNPFYEIDQVKYGQPSFGTWLLSKLESICSIHEAAGNAMRHRNSLHHELGLLSLLF